MTLTQPTAGVDFAGGSVVRIAWTAGDDRALRSFDLQATYDGITWHPFVEALHESVAITDDRLIAHFLEHSELPQEQLELGLRNALATGKLNAVIFGSALSGNGVTRLLDHLVHSVDEISHRVRRHPEAGHAPHSPDDQR